ncbi:hypothetical protein JCM5353_006732 [Sporobolomyces roseus]
MVRFSNQYSHCCYGGSPLSKRLLPFYLRILHHSFSPTEWRHVRLLNEAIVRDPGIALRIKEVDLYSFVGGFKQAQDVIEFASLLRQIPNVEEIGLYMGTQDMASVFWTELDANPTLFPKLRSLEMEFLNDSDSLPSATTGLTPLRHLQNLTTLTACWPFESTTLPVPTVQLPNLEYLRFRGEGCGDASNLALIQSCPSLHTVEFEEISMSHSLDQVLPGISPNLQDLSLTGHSDRPIDQYLSHLTGLRYLHLGHSSYDRNLAAHLSLLPFLESLTLDPAQHDVIVVEELLNGPNRLQHLRYLTLEFTLGVKFGVRADPEILNWQAGTRWDVGYPSLRYSSHQLASLEASVIRARSQGISLSGQVLLLREEMENYLIESYNRALLHLAATGDSSKYLEAQTTSSAYDFPLPFLDLAHLDITQSRIAKVPTPQPDWFVLTLQ